MPNSILHLATLAAVLGWSPAPADSRTVVEPASPAPEKTRAAVDSDADADAAALVSDDGTTRHLSYEDDVIDGERLAWDGTILVQRPTSRFPSMIEVRAHFVPELIGLASDL